MSGVHFLIGLVIYFLTGVVATLFLFAASMVWGAVRGTTSAVISFWKARR